MLNKTNLILLTILLFISCVFAVEPVHFNLSENAPWRKGSLELNKNEKASLSLLELAISNNDTCILEYLLIDEIENKNDLIMWFFSNSCFKRLMNDFKSTNIYLHKYKVEDTPIIHIELPFHWDGGASLKLKLKEIKGIVKIYEWSTTS